MYDCIYIYIAIHMIDKSLADMNYYFSSLSLGMQMQ